ncbi:hypothetical protein H6G06_23550 [Anabaena sphaerica FACHB-251]|uniref:Uncharacterized protein n=1 Tax=Anabaena sphaerica FACHB-251 TaxID=2692883 RepID=A0A927A1N9_9NOST|nr:hypothetical protein [Anabaena sphaerica]MBD2296377.1 hypothetical protein [Anabaena sphaerica FACHB-251]
MKSRIRTHKKRTREETPDLSSVPFPGMFEGRSFAVQGKVEKPDVKTSLMRAERYGHHIQNTLVAEPNKEYHNQTKQPVIQRWKASNFLPKGKKFSTKLPFLRRKKNIPPQTSTTNNNPNDLVTAFNPGDKLSQTSATKNNPNDLVEAFNPGDKLYGLRDQRPQDAVKPKAGNMATVQDELNNQFIGTKGIGRISKTMGSLAKQNDQNSANDIKKWKKGASYGEEKTPPKTQEQRLEALEYKEWLEKHPKYSPKNKIVRGEALSSPYRQWDRVKKSCKAGIEYAVTHGKRVHFILDDIDLEAVINKQNYQTKQPEVKVDPITGDSQQNITASELRFIYRNWHDPLFKKGVQFWQGGKEVPAPWEQDPKSWQRYSPKSKNSQEAKKSLRLGSKIQNLGRGILRSLKIARRLG